jgi:hypothetical protein
MRINSPFKNGVFVVSVKSPYQELIRNGFRSLAVTYPAQSLDPDFLFTPFYYAYSVLGNEIFLQISAFLPLITARLYTVIGNYALPIVPVTGSVLTAVATYHLGKLAKVKHAYWLLWASVFTTPLLFYSLELWDHSLGTAAAIWAITGLAYGWQSKKWLPAFAGGMALGFGFGQRPEIYVFAVALGMAWLLLAGKEWRLTLAIVGGAGLVALLLWYYQWQWTGHPLGMATAPHLLGYGVPTNKLVSGPNYPRFVTLMRFILYGQGQDKVVFMAALLILIGIFLTIFSLRLVALQKKQLLWLAFGTLICGYGIMVWQTYGQPIPGILSTFPLVALSFVYIEKGQDNPAERKIYLLALLTTLFFLGLMLAFWPSSGGIQWGARYLLPSYPLLLFLSFYVFTVQSRRLTGSLRRTFERTAVGLLTASVLLQIMSTSLIYKGHMEQVEIRDAVQELPAEVILTNNPFFPSFMASVNDKQFLYINKTEDLEILIPRLMSHSFDRFALLTEESMPINVPQQVDNIVITASKPLIYELSFIEHASGTHD